MMILVSCSDDTVFKGQVVNQNGEPVEKVMVQVMSSDIYIMTGEDGKFTIDTKGRGNELIFKKDGYKMQLQELKSSNMKIELVQD
mgnify:CR=1 FL=1